ncbi:MAG: hypothetical protein ACP5JT_01525 [Thermoplasmata archaeon]
MIGIENLPEEEEIAEKIYTLDTELKELIKLKTCDMEKLKEIYEKIEVYQDVINVRRRINSGVFTMLYFLYTMIGNVFGIILSVIIFFTTVGNFGHIILLLNIAGSLVSILIGLKSIEDEKKYLKSLLIEIKDKL